MNISDKEYHNLVSYASIISRSTPHISSEDLVNNALCVMLEAKEPFVELRAKYFIKSLFLNEKHQALTNKRNRTYTNGESDRYCKSCKEVLPFNAFYTYHRSSGVQDITYKCKKCLSKSANTWIKNKCLSDLGYKKKKYEREKEWKRKNINRVRQYDRERYYKKKATKLTTTTD